MSTLPTQPERYSQDLVAVEADRRAEDNLSSAVQHLALAAVYFDLPGVEPVDHRLVNELTRRLAFLGEIVELPSTSESVQSQLVMLQPVRELEAESRLPDDNQPEAHVPEVPAEVHSQPSDEVVSSADTEAKTEQPKVPVFIRHSVVRIGDESYPLYENEHRYLRFVHNHSAPITAEEVADGLHPGDESSTDEELDNCEDVLMDLHKRGLLNEDVEISADETDAVAYYTVNLDVPSALDKRHIIEIDGIRLYLTDFDLRIVSALATQKTPNTMPAIARNISVDGGMLPKRQFDHMIRTIKKYLVPKKIAYRGNMRIGSGRKSVYHLTDVHRDSVRQVFLKK